MSKQQIIDDEVNSVRQTLGEKAFNILTSTMIQKFALNCLTRFETQSDDRIKELEEEVNKLRTESLHRGMSILENDLKISDLETERDKLKEEVNKWRSEALKQARNVNSLTDKNHSLDLEVESLKEENKRLREENENYKRQLMKFLPMA